MQGSFDLAKGSFDLATFSGRELLRFLYPRVLQQGLSEFICLKVVDSSRSRPLDVETNSRTILEIRLLGIESLMILEGNKSARMPKFKGIRGSDY